MTNIATYFLSTNQKNLPVTKARDNSIVSCIFFHELKNGRCACTPILKHGTYIIFIGYSKALNFRRNFTCMPPVVDAHIWLNVAYSTSTNY
jgi:hypothetical protein